MKLKNPMLVVTDIDKSVEFYKKVFGLHVIMDFGANKTLTGGLALQTVETYKDFIGKSDISFGGNNFEIYFEEDNFDKFIDKVVPGGIAIIDSALISSKCERTDITCFYVPATALANENDLKGMANIILTGKLIKETGIASIETVRETMKKVIPPRKANLLEANMKAIEIGMAQ